MRISITGGTGFIGSRLALRANHLGNEVIVLGQVNTDAEADNRRDLEKAGIPVVLGSVTDPDAIRSAIEGSEVIFHLAAAQHEANVPDSHFTEVNVRGTECLLDLAAREDVRRFVYGSTIGVYGSALSGQIDENSQIAPDNIYGKTKSAAEDIVRNSPNCIATTIIRISETYGPGDRRLLKLFKAIANRTFFLIGDGENKHQLIYVDDLVDGMLLAAEAPVAVGQTFTLAGREVLTTRQMVETIAGVLNSRMNKLRAPMWPFVAMAHVLEKTLSPLGIQPPLHRRRLDFFRKSFHFSPTKSRELLGFYPEWSFEQGIASTAEWYRQRDLL